MRALFPGELRAAAAPPGGYPAAAALPFSWEGREYPSLAAAAPPNGEPPPAAVAAQLRAHPRLLRHHHLWYLFYDPLVLGLLPPGANPVLHDPHWSQSARAEAASAALLAAEARATSLEQRLNAALERRGADQAAPPPPLLPAAAEPPPPARAPHPAGSALPGLPRRLGHPPLGGEHFCAGTQTAPPERPLLAEAACQAAAPGAEAGCQARPTSADAACEALLVAAPPEPRLPAPPPPAVHPKNTAPPRAGRWLDPEDVDDPPAAVQEPPRPYVAPPPLGSAHGGRGADPADECPPPAPPPPPGAPPALAAGAQSGGVLPGPRAEAGVQAGAPPPRCVDAWTAPCRQVGRGVGTQAGGPPPPRADAECWAARPEISEAEAQAGGGRQGVDAWTEPFPRGVRDVLCGSDAPAGGVAAFGGQAGPPAALRAEAGSQAEFPGEGGGPRPPPAGGRAEAGVQAGGGERRWGLPMVGL